MNIKLNKCVLVAILLFSLIVSGCENKVENNDLNDKVDMYSIKKDGKMGIIDKTGKILLEPKYEELDFYPNGSKKDLVKAKSEGKYGFINLKGKWVVDPKYDNCGLFSQGLASILVSGRVGFIDRNGKMIIDPNFDVFPKGRYGDYYNIYTFNNDGLCVVQVNGRFGVIDKKGDFVIEPKYDEDFSFSEGLAAVKQSGNYGYIDKTGKVIIDFKYKSADSFSDGAALVNDGKEKFIDSMGKELFNMDFNYARRFENGTTYVDFNKIVDKTGKIVLDSNKEYEVGDNVKEGLVLAWFKDTEKYGFVDISGKKVIEGKYYSAHNFYQGLSTVINKDYYGNERWGVIDKNGNEVIKLQYEYISYFDKNGIASIYTCDDEEYKDLNSKDKKEYLFKNGKKGYIDTKGKCIWEPTR